MPYPVNDPLVIIVGPTAVGKTPLAFKAACLLEGEIISADSRLFYRGMDIGTAKPSLEMQKRIPHHLIDFADPDEVISLRVFQQKVEECIQDIKSRHRLPILVGGTGQYIRAILEGWSIPPQKPDERLRQVLAGWSGEIGAEGIYQKLMLLDPIAASRIDFRNTRRTIRALEVVLGTGRLFSEQRKKMGANHAIKMIGLTLPREQLYHRIDLRIEQMINNGLIDEVSSLFQKGFSTELPSMSAIGYREIGDYVNNKQSLDEAVLLMKRRTRLFVRRQANWFKADDPDIHWFLSTPKVNEEIVKYIQSDTGWLAKKE